MGVKKYIRLKGDEVATPEDQKRAALFLEWYANNRKEVVAHINVEVDEDLLSDTLLSVYDSIALKGREIDNYKSYFLMAYRNTFLAAKAGKQFGGVEGIDVVDAEIVTPQLDEMDLRDEILAHVRGSHDMVSVSIFEIYAAMYPEFGSARIAELTGLPISRIKSTLSAIRADLQSEYSANYKLLSNP